MQDGSLIARFSAARRDRTLAVLEGLHALKHALRFGADVLEAVSGDPQALERLARELAPDVAAPIRDLVTAIDADVFRRLAPLTPPTGVIALARRRPADAVALLADARPAPLVLLEDPRDLGNLGACVRVAAAADIGGLLTTGSHDPWHPDALRGSAGLHYALPVARLEGLAPLAAPASRGRPLLALDPGGEPLSAAHLDPRAVLVFGSERRGVSSELATLADARVGLPMRRGVSSLNLATSVAAVLFAWRLSPTRHSPLVTPAADDAS